MAYNNQLKGIVNTADVNLTTILMENMIGFLDHGLINAGSFFNVERGDMGLYDASEAKLRMVADPRYTDGQVWESYRSNWVWETGLDSSDDPISVSGVWVNGSYYENGNGTKPFHIDYPNGQIIFDTALTSTDLVEVNHSNKWVRVMPQRGMPWFREIQADSFRNDHPHFLQSGSGEWAQLAETRTQLPAIGVEVVPNRSFKPYQLGGTQWAMTDIIFHVVAEEEWVAANLTDIISYQNDRTIVLFDSNQVAASGSYPLDVNGSKTTNANTEAQYPQYVDTYPYQKCFITNTRGQGITQMNPELYIGTVRCTTEVEMTNI